jgi:hypothetical protein
MKKFLTLLIFISNSALAETGDVDVINTVGPKNNASFAVARDTEIKGGYRSVANITERNAITTARRKEGMWVRTNDTGNVYVLGSDLSTWTQVVFSSIDGSGGTNYCSYWTDTDTLAGEAACTYNPSTNTLTTDNLKANTLVAPVTDANFSAGTVYSSDLNPSGTNGNWLNSISKILVAPDGLTIAFGAQTNYTTQAVYAYKCDDNACTSYTTSTIVSDLAVSGSNYDHNFDAMITPGGRIAFIYGKTADSYAQFCRCDSAHTCASFTCNSTAYATNSMALRLITRGSTVGIFYHNTNPKYIICNDPDSATPCSSMGSETNIDDGNHYHVRGVFANPSGYPIFSTHEGRVYKCSNEACSSYTTDSTYFSYLTPWENLSGSSSYMYMTQSLSSNHYLRRCSLPSCSGFTTLATIPATSGCVNYWADVMVTASGIPIMKTNSTNCSSTHADYSLYTCADAACASYSTTVSTKTYGTTGGTGQFYLNSMAETTSGDIAFLSGDLNASHELYLTHYQLGNQSVSGVDVGQTSTRFANGYFDGTVEVGTLKVATGPAPFGKIGVGVAPNTNVDIAGDLSSRAVTMSAFTGTQNNYTIGSYSSARISGSSTPVITGISANNQNGKILNLANVGSVAIQISNDSSGSTASNRVITGSGANYSIPAGAEVSLQYDSSSSRWRMISAGVFGGVAANEVAYGSATGVITSEAAFSYNPSTNTLSADVLKSNIVGSASSPNILINDTNSGIFRNAIDEIGISRDGYSAILIGSLGEVHIAQYGSVSAPTLTFYEPQTGFYRSGADAIAVTNGGVKTLEFKSDNQVAISRTGTTSSPAITLGSDANTGFIGTAGSISTVLDGTSVRTDTTDGESYVTAGVSGGNLITKTNRLTTSNATTTDLITKTFSDSVGCWIDVDVAARSTDASEEIKIYKRRTYIYVNGSSSHNAGSIQTPVADLESTTLTWIVDVDDNSGSNLRVRVTGVSDRTISWAGTLRAQCANF